MEILSFWKPNSVFKKQKLFKIRLCCCCLVTKSCLTLLPPHELQPSRLLGPWNFPGRNTGVGCRFFLAGIFLTQEGWNLGLPYCTWILYSEPPGKPDNVHYMSLLHDANLSIQLVGTFTTESISLVSVITVSWFLSVGRKKKSDTLEQLFRTPREEQSKLPVDLIGIGVGSFPR